MKLNCKKGDLAIVVRCSEVRLIGCVVVCVEPIMSPLFEAGWLLQEPLPNGSTGILDRCLKPINPGDGPDETLAWADVPETVIA